MLDTMQMYTGLTVRCAHAEADGVQMDGVNGADAAGANGEGMNVDGARGVGTRGANVDWGANAGACSGWSEGQGEQHGLRGHGLQTWVWRAQMVQPMV